MEELERLRTENAKAKAALQTAVMSTIAQIWLLGPRDLSVKLQMNFIRDMVKAMDCEIDGTNEAMLYGTGFTKHAIGLIMGDKVEWDKVDQIEAQEIAKNKASELESDTNPMHEIGHGRGDD